MKLDLIANNTSDIELEAAVKLEVNKLTNSLFELNFNEDNIGLFTGISGTCFMLSQIYLITKDPKILDKMYDCFHASIKHIENNQYPSYLFSTGIAGWGWLVAYVEGNGIMEIDSSELLKDMDEAIRLRMGHYLSISNYDQVNGAIGIARYFLYRGITEPAETIIDFLYNEKIEDSYEIKWSRGLLGEERLELYDFGLSHGIAGIIYFLNKCYKLKIKTELCEKLIRGAIAFLNNNKQDFEVVGSFFPNAIGLKDYSRSNNIPQRSRLSWCYGDLGIWYIVRKVGLTLNDYELTNTALNGLLALATTPTDETEIKSAGFCHGTAGIAHIFNKLYFESQRNEFKLAGEYWIKASIRFGNTDMYDGYKFYVNDAERNLRLEYCDNLLEGQNGVLAMYLSIENPELNWDEVFMLD